MIEIDLNTAFHNLEGVPSKNGEEIVILGKTLASAFAVSNKGDALKFTDWARSLYKGHPIQVDKSDFATIKSFVSGNDQFTNLLKAQLLEKLDEAEKKINNSTYFVA